jgi:hypothetical protein
MKKYIEVTEDFGTDPRPDPLVRGTDPRIRIPVRIPTKISRIRNTGNISAIQWWASH